MADEHALAERAPCEPLGRLKAARTQETALAVDDVGIAVEHAGQLVSRQLAQQASAYHFLQGVVLGKRVARVHIDDIVARSLRQSLVHRVVDALVGLRGDDDVVLVAFRTVRLPLVCLGHCQRPVGRSPVDNQVLHLLVGLTQHAVERPLQHSLGVISDGDNRETYHSL